jgi:malate synthase
MSERVSVAGLAVARPLFELVEKGVLPGTGILPKAFWAGLAELALQFGRRNRQLLVQRDELQEQIDDWHRERRGKPQDRAAYRRFLVDIGYLLPSGDDFHIQTDNVDEEIARIAGPQLMAPLCDAAQAIDAANARWGSLFDALYHADVLDHDEVANSGSFNPVRCAQVIAAAKEFLDQAAPLAEGSYAQAIAYDLHDGQLSVTLSNGQRTGLSNPDQFCGYRMAEERLAALLLINHGLHIEIVFAPHQPGQGMRPTGICDLILEAAISAIQDGEDSVVAVDADDKVALYRNWLGLMRGDLSASVCQDGVTVQRHLAEDRRYLAVDGTPLVLPGRGVMLVRNVGLLMSCDAVLDANGVPLFEGLLDAVMTAACALHDLKGLGSHRNSRTGSVYIVKPKLHGAEEVAFTVDMFTAIEQLLGMAPHTLKLGLVDEERRTTLNLKECLRAARDRLCLVNTCYLDRVGDEIHTAMEAGAMQRRQGIKQSDWLQGYEDWNVDVGLSCGLAGRAQIGKGMWAMPAQMAAMMAGKVADPEAGASSARVPNAAAATLHAMHYHQVDVAERQAQLAGRNRAVLDDLLRSPRCEPHWTADEVQRELDSNVHGILAYVVRWVDQGVGASRVPDIHDVELVEDRSTLRLSCQHVANWLYHGVVSEQQVHDSLARMAQQVDRQNRADFSYIPMAAAYDGLAFQAACELIFEAQRAPNGYTDPVLHRYRRSLKEVIRQQED